MNNEEVEHLVERGRERGYVTAEDIAEVLAEVDLTIDQIEAIYMRLLDLGVEVTDEEGVEVEDPDDASTDKASWRTAGPHHLDPALDVFTTCLLYTSDAADDLLCVDLGGRRIIKKKKTTKTQ